MNKEKFPKLNVEDSTRGTEAFEADVEIDPRDRVFSAIEEIEGNYVRLEELTNPEGEFHGIFPTGDVQYFTKDKDTGELEWFSVTWDVAEGKGELGKLVGEGLSHIKTQHHKLYGENSKRTRQLREECDAYVLDRYQNDQDVQDVFDREILPQFADAEKINSLLEKVGGSERISEDFSFDDLSQRLQKADSKDEILSVSSDLVIFLNKFKKLELTSEQIKETRIDFSAIQTWTNHIESLLMSKADNVSTGQNPKHDIWNNDVLPMLSQTAVQQRYYQELKHYLSSPPFYEQATGLYKRVPE